MAFHMTPGMEGNPAQQKVQGLGACGGDGQPPCDPLFEKEKREREVQKFKRAKIKKAAVPVKDAPIKPVKEVPIKEAPIKVPIKAPIAEIEVPAEGGPKGVKAKIAK